MAGSAWSAVAASIPARRDMATADIQLRATGHLVYAVRAALDLVSGWVSGEFPRERLGSRALRYVCDLHGRGRDFDLCGHLRIRVFGSGDSLVRMFRWGVRHAGGD